jgi:hypothetical protein
MAFSGFSQQLGAPSKALNTCRGFHLALMLPNNQFSLRLALRRRLKPLRNLLSLQLHAREIKGALPPALFLAAMAWLLLSRRMRGDSTAALPVDLPKPSQVVEPVRRWQRFTTMLIFLLTVALWMSGEWHGIPTGVVSFVPIVALSMIGVMFFMQLMGGLLDQIADPAGHGAGHRYGG